MTNSEKIHDVRYAFNLIKTVKDDTDEDLWAYEILEDALDVLKQYFEEYDI